MSVEIFGSLAPRPFDLGPLHTRFDDGDDLVGDLILEVKDILESTVKSICPQMRTLWWHRPTAR